MTKSEAHRAWRGRSQSLTSLLPTLAYCSAFIILGLVTGALGPALPEFAQQTGATIDATSILFSVVALGHLLGGILVARLYDHRSSHHIMASALTVIAGCLLATPLVRTLPLLAVIFFMVGVAKSTVDTGGNTLLLWAHGQKVAPYMNVLHFCFGTGACIGPILVSQMLVHGRGLVWAYWLLALVTAPLAFWYMSLPSPSPPASPHHDEGREFPWTFYLPFGVFLFLYVGTEVSFGGWIFVYARANHLGDMESIGYLAAAFWGSLTIGRLALMPLVIRLQPQTVLRCCLLACFFSVSLMTIQLTATTAWLGTIGLGVSMAPIFPNVIVMANQRAKMTGRVVGSLIATASAGAMVLPWSIGQMFTLVGYDALLWFTLAAIALAMAVLEWTLRWKRAMAAGA